MKLGEVDIGNTGINTGSRDDIPALPHGRNICTNAGIFNPIYSRFREGTSFRASTGAAADRAQEVAHPGDGRREAGAGMRL